MKWTHAQVSGDIAWAGEPPRNDRSALSGLRQQRADPDLRIANEKVAR